MFKIKRLQIPMYLIVLCCSQIQAQTASDKPNIVLIVLDDMNDYIGVMGGHPQAITPHMDQLAREGVLFTNAHSNAPVCAPSRASFMSGLLPSTTENYGFKNRMQNPVLKNSKTLPEYARENGYKAYQTGKIQHHSRKSDWNQMGIPKNQEPLAYNGRKQVAHPSVPAAFGAVGALDGTFAPLSDIPTIQKSKDAPGYTGWWDVKNKKPFRYVNDEDRDLMTDEKSAIWFDKKIKTIENSSDKSPFFIAFGIMNPHTPHVAPKKYFDLYPLETLEIPVINGKDNEDCFYDEVLSGKGKSHFSALLQSYPKIEEGIKTYLQAYLAEVSFADEIVGQILKTIDASSFKNNTIVILTSDHGYNIGEKEYLFKNSPWEESTRIPLMIKDPRNFKNAGKTVSNPVSLIDLYPTISDFCDFKGATIKSDTGASLDGFSLRTLVENPDKKQWAGPDLALTLIKNKESNKPEDQNYSIRSENYRYIRYSNGKEELYDHTKDPYEWVNEIENKEYKKIRMTLRTSLKEQIPNIF